MAEPAESGSASAAVFSTELAITGDLYTPRWGLAAAALDTKVYLFGGYIWFHGAERFHDDFYELDTQSWVMRRLLSGAEERPCRRFGHTLVADADTHTLWLFGGRSADYVFGDMWSYSAATRRWTQVFTPQTDGQPAPLPRSWHSAIFHQGSIYIVGGWSQATEAFGDVWRFDCRTCQWQCLCGPHTRIGRIEEPEGKPVTHPSHTEFVREPSFPHEQRDTSREGQREPSNVPREGAPFARDPRFMRDGVFMWSPASLKETFLREGRTCHQSFIWRGGLYVYGGISNEQMLAAGDLWRLDLTTFDWTIEPTAGGVSPQARVSYAATLCGDDSWVLHGGLTSYPSGGAMPTGDVWVLHIPTLSWHKKTSVDTTTFRSPARYGHAAVCCTKTHASIFFGGADAYASAHFTTSWRLEFLATANSYKREFKDLHERWSELMRRFEKERRERLAMEEKLDKALAGMAALTTRIETVNNQLQMAGQSVAVVEQVLSTLRRVGQTLSSVSQPNGTRSPLSSTAAPSPQALSREAS